MIEPPGILALTRGLHLAAMLSLLGSAGFITWTLPAAAEAPERLRRRLNGLLWLSGLVAILAGAAWFTLQSAAIAGADDLSDLGDALPVVAMHTRYGNILLARLGLLAVATGVAVLMPRRRIPLYLILLLTAVAASLQGPIGHAGATEGAIGDGLLVSEALHLIAAGIWLGALLPLGITVLTLPTAQAASVCERFTPIGLGCVLVLAGTGLAQGLELIGGLPALFGTAYGHFALMKIALFVIALVLAALNRLWLTDRLASGARAARRHLLLSISLETLAGLAIVTAAAFMASSPPAAHTEPVWPFSWQFSLITVTEDAEFRREVITSLLLIGGATVLTIGALVAHRLRLLALALAVLAALIAWRGPSLSLLTVEAYPTSFQTSPRGFSAASIVRGQALYGPHCASCHGPDGEGNGPAAASLRIKPADLTMPHLWEHADGEMFWWLSHGVDDPEGGLAMPGFAASLPAEDIWALIDYVRARNAGLAMQQDAAFDIPVRAPGFPQTCNGVNATRTDDLRGYALHVVADAPPALPPIPPQAGVSTVTVALREGAAPEPGSCTAADPAAWKAYAILANVAPDALAGAEFLVDPNGWLRAVHRPGSPGGWQSRDQLIAAINGICTNQINSLAGGDHDHHH
jgi:putative copper export protein/mono/diheme cytochrome c family protein